MTRGHLQIGVDSGGTFTDTVIVSDDGRVAIGKAPSTPDAPARGVVDSITVAAAELGLGLEEALSAASIVAHGTTVGLNALLTRAGAEVGLITTAGFEDVVPMARMNKAVGLDHESFTDSAAWSKPPLLLDRSNIVGVRERVDRNGTALVELDEDDVLDAIERFRAARVRAVAVCLLWSFLNDSHERRVGELLATHLPDVHVTLSSDLVPRIGEYERAITVVVNAYVAPVVRNYLADLDERLRAASFGGSFLVTKSSRGVQDAASIVARPLETLKSGPVGGLAAAATIGAALGHDHVIASDVGGTSFDVGLVVGGRPQHAPRPMLDRYALAMPMVDIESIGTGGGSIAWLDPDSGALRVGPQSAGADPGPACYRRGGQLPTVTDAAVVLGYLDRLGGSLELDRGAAIEAVSKEIAVPLGISVERAAEGILDVSNAQMADLVRRVTVLRGYDPRDFVLYAFGGAAPQYAGRYAADLGVRSVVVPVFASVFSAYGAATSDLRAGTELDAPCPFPPPMGWFDERFGELEARARAEVAAAAVTDEVAVQRWVSLRFRRQVHQLEVPLPAGTVGDAIVEALRDDFQAEYERTFGPGTAYADAGIELVGLRVEAVSPLPTVMPTRPDASLTGPIGTREASFGGELVACPVFDGLRTKAGLPISGPAFVEQSTTTLVVYPGQQASIDEIGNVTLELGGHQ